MRWGFNDGVYQNYGFLGYDAVYSGIRVEEFRRNFHLAPNMQVAVPSETSVQSIKLHGVTFPTTVTPIE